MSDYDPLTDPILSQPVISKIILERIRLAQTTSIGPQMIHDMDTRVREDYFNSIFDSLIFSLETYLIVRARMTGTETVPFSTTAPYSTDVTTYRSPWQERKPNWLAIWFPRKTKVVHVEGRTRVDSTVTMERKVYDAFPQSQIIWPERLGQPQVLEIFQQRYSNH